MGKHSNASNGKSKGFSKIPIRIILFWYKTLQNYIIKLKTENIGSEENIEYPTINIGKHKKMNILELYKRIRNHIKKHFPLIHNEIKNSHKELIIKGEKKEEEKAPIRNEDQSNNKNEKNISAPFKVEKIVLTDIYRDKDLSEEIRNINEGICVKISHLFKSYKFDEETARNCNNYFVKMIVSDREESDSSYKRDDYSTTSMTSNDKKNYSKNEFDKNNKVTFVTHLEKRPSLKIKMFKISSI